MPLKLVYGGKNSDENQRT